MTDHTAQYTVLKVGMADMKVASGPPHVLKTVGLGSCVGLVLFDPVTGKAAMAHIMLPESDIARDANFNRMKYADTVIPDMIGQLAKIGAFRSRLVAKMAGGAQMFAVGGKNEMMRIGPRNVEMCKKILGRLSIPVKAADTGGNYGRTIQFHCSTGLMTITSVNHEAKEL